MRRLLLLVTLLAACGGPDAATQAPTQLAPDFTLTLGDGSSYTLSADPRPVYLVFWAEW